MTGGLPVCPDCGAGPVHGCTAQLDHEHGDRLLLAHIHPRRAFLAQLRLPIAVELRLLTPSCWMLSYQGRFLGRLERGCGNAEYEAFDATGRQLIAPYEAPSISDLATLVLMSATQAQRQAA